MKTMDTIEVTARGGRHGTVDAPDVGWSCAFHADDATPVTAEAPPTPELLFATAYAACFGGAMIAAAEKMDLPTEGFQVRTRVGLFEDHLGLDRLSVEVHVDLPGVEQDDAENIVQQAHAHSPFSRALSGNVPIRFSIN